MGCPGGVCGINSGANSDPRLQQQPVAAQSGSSCGPGGCPGTKPAVAKSRSGAGGGGEAATSRPGGRKAKKRARQADRQQARQAGRQQARQAGRRGGGLLGLVGRAFGGAGKLLFAGLFGGGRRSEGSSGAAGGQALAKKGGCADGKCNVG